MPVNVRLLLATGAEIPLQCVYAGIIDGAHMWDALVDAAIPLDRGARILIGELPAHCGVRTAVQV